MNYNDCEILNTLIKHCNNGEIDIYEVDISDIKAALQHIDLSGSKISQIKKVCRSGSDQILTDIVEGKTSLHSAYTKLRLKKSDHAASDVIDVVVNDIKLSLYRDKINFKIIIYGIRHLKLLYKSRMIKRSEFQKYINEIVKVSNYHNIVDIWIVYKELFKSFDISVVKDKEKLYATVFR